MAIYNEDTNGYHFKNMSVGDMQKLAQLGKKILIKMEYAHKHYAAIRNPIYLNYEHYCKYLKQHPRPVRFVELGYSLSKLPVLSKFSAN